MPYGLRCLNRPRERTIRGAAASTVQVKYGGCGVRRETCNSAPNSASPRLRVADNTSLIDDLHRNRNPSVSQKKLWVDRHNLQRGATEMRSQCGVKHAKRSPLPQSVL